MNIFVGNLSFDAKEADVHKAFAVFGAVSSVAIVMEKKGKKSRGFGFVQMPDEQEGLAAIAALAGKEILGRPVNVMLSLPKKPKNQISAEKGAPRPDFKRTGKYKEGRRTISYMKQRLDAGITTPVGKRKYKPNPLRWRKEVKPWQRRPGAKPRRSGSKIDYGKK